MKINENEIIVNGQKIGVYDLYEIDRLVRTLTPNEAVQEVLQQGADTVLEVLQNATDQRLVSSFQIAHF